MRGKADVGALMKAALNLTRLGHLTIMGRINPRDPYPSTIVRSSFERGDVQVFSEVYAALTELSQYEPEEEE